MKLFSFTLFKTLFPNLKINKQLKMSNTLWLSLLTSNHSVCFTTLQIYLFFLIELPQLEKFQIAFFFTDLHLVLMSSIAMNGVIQRLVKMAIVAVIVTHELSSSFTQKYVSTTISYYFHILSITSTYFLLTYLWLFVMLFEVDFFGKNMFISFRDGQ